MVTNERLASISISALVAFGLLSAVAPRSARADDAPAPPAGAATAAAPRVHHTAPATTVAGEPLVLGATIDHPEEVRSAYVVYRTSAGGPLGAAPFARAASERTPYVAIVPAEQVRGPRLSYAIEIERTDGTRVATFASREDPHAVEVVDDPADAREAALSARLGGRRSVVRATGEYAYFGATDATVRDASGRTTTERVPDAYYRAEAAYTYRFLRTIAEFGLRVGAVRGRSVVPGENDPSKFDVGLNYGAPRLRFRCAPFLHLEVEELTSVTEVGFSIGGGGAVLLGDAYGSHLTLGVESIEVFGTRGYTRLDIPAGRRFMIAPAVEVTTMPHATTAGVRLLGDVDADLGRGFTATLRGGYQARTFSRGGPTLGGGLAYAF